MLDKRMLIQMPPETIFATGIGLYPKLYIGPIKWIAVRGRVADWAIYYLKADCTMEFISREGDKCITKEVIKQLVPCDDEAFKAYRY